MTYNELFFEFRKRYDNQHDVIFFEILFSTSKLIKNKEDFASQHNNQIDFKIKDFDKKCKMYFKKEMPLAHVTSQTTFMGLKFQVSKKVLAPRDITEQMVKDFIYRHRDDSYAKVLDMCCGCGCIGITIKKNCPQMDVTCVDKYWGPLFDTNANAIAHKTQITIDVSDAKKYLAKLGSLDILISNPPYINKKNFKNNKMFRWENKKALIAKDNGLEFYKIYFEWLNKHTFKEAWLEIGYDLVDALKQELAKYPNLVGQFITDRNYLIVFSK